MLTGRQTDVTNLKVALSHSAKTPKNQSVICDTVQSKVKTLCSPLFKLKIFGLTK